MVKLLSVLGMEQLHKPSDICISSIPAAVLRGRPYQNNSIVMLEDIGIGDDALLCITNYTACCQFKETVLGNWFFPSGTRVPSDTVNETSGEEWDFYRTRGQMVVRLNRRRGGEEGIYHCEIPNAINVTQTIFIGVYSATTGECLCCRKVRFKPDMIYSIVMRYSITCSNINIASFPDLLLFLCSLVCVQYNI